MKQIHLNDNERPRSWYNILADLPEPLDPPMDPATDAPMHPSKLQVIFPDALLEQEMSTQRWIEIPDEVQQIYSIWRSTPLVRAERLEQALGTPARIFYKFEGVSPAGSHKPNTAVPQAYYNAKQGIKKLTTETGAGQWGASLSFACQYYGIEALVYMVKVSYEQKPYRRYLMETWGGQVLPSPSNTTKAGRGILEKDPASPGSLGIAISEAVELALERPDTHYALGSVLNHVMLHQTVLGLEARTAMEKMGMYPDVVIASAGGGSNFAGLAFPFLENTLAGKHKDTRFIAVEPSSCPSLTKGEYRYDFGDATGLTPMMKMYTLGNEFVPPSIHAGGLRYHGMSPIVSKLYHLGLIEAVAVPQTGIFQAALEFARTEGFVPAPEAAHSIRAVIDEAIRCKETGEAKTILFNLSGHGLLDLASYQKYMEGELTD